MTEKDWKDIHSIRFKKVNLAEEMMDSIQKGKATLYLTIGQNDFEIVPNRCRECKFWSSIKGSSGEWIDICNKNGTGWNEDDYCSKWEMKDVQN